MTTSVDLGQTVWALIGVRKICERWGPAPWDKSMADALKHAKFGRTSNSACISRGYPPGREKSLMIHSAVLIQYMSVMDRRTDRGQIKAQAN